MLIIGRLISNSLKVRIGPYNNITEYLEALGWRKIPSLRSVCINADIFTFMFMHLADAFIQSDLQCIQAIHFLSVYVVPGN